MVPLLSSHFIAVRVLVDNHNKSINVQRVYSSTILIINFTNNDFTYVDTLCLNFIHYYYLAQLSLQCPNIPYAPLHTPSLHFSSIYFHQNLYFSFDKYKLNGTYNFSLDSPVSVTFRRLCIVLSHFSLDIVPFRRFTSAFRIPRRNKIENRGTKNPPTNFTVAPSSSCGQWKRSNLAALLRYN